MWLAAEHPLITAGVVLVLVVIAVLLIRKLWRFGLQLGEKFRRARAKMKHEGTNGTQETG